MTTDTPIAIQFDENLILFLPSHVRVKDPGDIVKIPRGDVCEIEFRGGLRVFAVWNVVDCQVECFWDLCLCDSLNATQAMESKESIVGDIQKIITIAEDLLWSHDLAERIRDTNDLLVIDEEQLLILYSNMAALFWSCESLFGIQFGEQEGLEINLNNLTSKAYLTDHDKRFEKIFELKEQIDACLKEQLSRIGEETPGSSVAYALGCLNSEEGLGIATQKNFFENVSASTWYEGKPISQETLKKDVVDILLSTEDGGEIFGSPAWAKERKTIICSEKPMAPQAFARQVRFPGGMIMHAEELEAYNELAPADKRLVFQPGHPQNGCTYLQHPLMQNLYFEVNTFHQSMLERKQNELLRILESLGAYRASVEIRHEQEEVVNRTRDRHWDASADVRYVAGSVSRNASGELHASASSFQRAKKDWTFNPPPHPALPEDLVFYPSEETWQQLAKSVLRGGLKSAVVDLEYKTEFGITEKHLSDLSVAAKVVLPSFELNLKRSFSEDLHQLTTTQWHYEVEFEDEAGNRAGGGGEAPKLAAVSPASGSDAEKVEALFRKRAKRYAQSEGHVNAEQRADLEAFAQKYGIDEFRMEELIEEAFE